MVTHIIVFQLKVSEIANMILLKGFKPLAFENDVTLLVCKKNRILRYHILKKTMQHVASLPCSIKQKIFSSNSFFNRIFRGGIRNGIVFDKNLFCTYRGIIWRIPLCGEQAGTVTKVFRFPNGRSSLNITTFETTLSDKASFTPGIYFGEYFSNPDKKKVSIYRIDKFAEVKNVYSFPAEQINHIHNIIFDPFRNCAWVLTGDFENSAGIWQATNDFMEMQCVAYGKQNFRSCVAFPVKEGLLYATDSQFEQNYIMMLDLQGQSPRIVSLFQINGPCIYGTNLCGNFIFTTATEPDVNAHITVRDLMSRKSGPGVVVNSSFVYLLTPSLQIFELFDNPKDKWPYYLAQFGNIQVPSGKNLSEYLVTYSVANRNNDLSTEIRHWDEVKNLTKQ